MQSASTMAVRHSGSSRQSRRGMRRMNMMTNMEIPELEKKISLIALHYGTRPQILKAVEETIELSEALIKSLNKGISSDEILDEMADTFIMMKQIQLFCQISDEELSSRIEMKVNRQIHRIQKEKEA